MLRLGCVGFGVGVWVRVKRIVPWSEGVDVFWGVAGVFFLEVCLEYVDDSSWVCCDVVSVWVTYGFKFGLVFGDRLQARRCFEVTVVALRALFI